MQEHKFKPGDVVQHFKRETAEDKTQYVYKIIGFGKFTETMEDCVIYEALYTRDFIKPHDIFVRPYDMFMSEVDHEKYPDIKQKYRFELLEE